MSGPGDAPLRQAARAVLAANDRGGYTVPTTGLYPFQWNWDSAFVAMGFATWDDDRALAELEHLAEGQWPDGMIPHIVFHRPSETYFPGPDVWGTEARRRAGGPATSGITQPPVFATALRFVWDAMPDGARQERRARVARLYRAALAWHRWWVRARDPGRTGLVAVLHNWETGSDNSPAWDRALARVPTTTSTPIRRRDTSHVDPAMRPTDVDYRRYIHLVDAYRSAGWDPERQWTVAPFKVADVQTTAILARATEDLAALASVLRQDGEAAELGDMRRRLSAGLTGQWRPALGRFVSHDLVAGSDIETATHAGFVPLLALDLDEPARAAATGEMTRWLADVRLGLPTVPSSSPDFDARRYWRGPVWAIVNWLLILGLSRNGRPDLAERLRADTLAAIERAGFAEHFDPLTGEGGGGGAFSWTAAAYLVLAESAPRNDAAVRQASTR
jgi:mannosylglycerate hydrolase